jgi:hypothetical protein
MERGIFTLSLLHLLHLGQVAEFFFFAVLGLELRAFTLSHSLPQPFFCEGIFEIGSLELFAWAGFEP